MVMPATRGKRPQDTAVSEAKLPRRSSVGLRAELSPTALRIACDSSMAPSQIWMRQCIAKPGGSRPGSNFTPRPLGRWSSAQDVEGQLAGAEETDTTETPNAAAAEALSLVRSLTRLELRSPGGHVGRFDNFWLSFGEIELERSRVATCLQTAISGGAIPYAATALGRRDRAGAVAAMAAGALVFEFPSCFRDERLARSAHALSLDAVLATIGPRTVSTRAN